jgi:pimeloyl-ACP methyl ester carboxylesterase
VNTIDKYEYQSLVVAGTDTYAPPILLGPAIGPGLNHETWKRFREEWTKQEKASNTLHMIDWYGTGDSTPRRQQGEEPLNASLWANQLSDYIDNKLDGKPIILLIQGGSGTIALEFIRLHRAKLSGLILTSPPSLEAVSATPDDDKRRRAWGVFQSWFGNYFYKYTKRRSFLKSFSERNLFASKECASGEWLDIVSKEAQREESRHAFFSFAAGYCKGDWRDAMRSLEVPVLLVFGKDSEKKGRFEFWKTVRPLVPEQYKESVFRESKKDKAGTYTGWFKNAQVSVEFLPGREVFWESPKGLTDVVSTFVEKNFKT